MKCTQYRWLVGLFVSLAGAAACTGGSSGTGGGTTTGDPAAPGVNVMAPVSAGGTVKSSKYKMSFTFGQATPNPGAASSKGYSVRGGVSGAEGN